MECQVNLTITSYTKHGCDVVREGPLDCAIAWFAPARMLDYPYERVPEWIHIRRQHDGNVHTHDSDASDGFKRGEGDGGPAA